MWKYIYTEIYSSPAYKNSYKGKAIGKAMSLSEIKDSVLRKLSTKGIREAFQNKPIESVSMLILPSDPSPLYCECLRLIFFLAKFLFYYWGCLVCCETDFVTLWVNFDQNNAKEGRPMFDKLMVRGLTLMVK